MYEFDKQLADGESHEETLDKFYSKWYRVSRVSMDAQKSGIDRVFTNNTDGFRYSVEYKADTTAANTGNAFIETVSVDTNNKPGWAYSSCSQIIIYYIPPKKIAYRFKTLEIKYFVNEWKKKYRIVEVPNNGYHTIGVLVPLKELAKLAYKVDEIRGKDDER
jgi:hypothetical protein